MHDVAVSAPLARMLAPRPRRQNDLLKLARELQPADPGLALELRGMALHEACAASRTPVAHAPWWRRAGRTVWSVLAAYGEARAQREILMLAERWETLQPELARDLRAACSRHA